jgi:hypothetical protein
MTNKTISANSEPSSLDGTEAAQSEIGQIDTELARQAFLAKSIFSAVEFNDAADLAKLLTEIAHPDIRDYLQRTPLMIAALRGHSECYLLLKHAGADLDAYDNRGVRAINYLKAYGSVTAQDILERRATIIRTIVTGTVAALQSKEKKD